MLYKDRKEAGEKLAAVLQAFKDEEHTLVVGLGKGGIVTGSRVAQALNLPFNFLIATKVSNLNNEKISLGVVTETGVQLHNDRLNPLFGYSPEMVSKLMRMELSKTLAFAAMCREDAFP